MSETPEHLNEVLRAIHGYVMGWSRKRKKKCRKVQSEIIHWYRHSLDATQRRSLRHIPSSPETKNVQKIIIENLALQKPSRHPTKVQFVQGGLLRCEATRGADLLDDVYLDSFRMKMIENQILKECSFAIQFQASDGGDMIFGNGIDIIDMLMETSHGCCFLVAPNAKKELHWLRHSSPCYLVEYILSLFELRLWEVWVHCTRQRQDRNETCKMSGFGNIWDPGNRLESPLYRAVQHPRFPSILSRECHEVVKTDIFRTKDDMRFSLLIQTTRFRSYAHCKDVASSVLRRSPFAAKLWFIDYLTSFSPMKIVSDTINRGKFDLASLLEAKRCDAAYDSLTTVPCSHLMTPINEFKALLCNRMHAFGADLLCDELADELAGVERHSGSTVAKTAVSSVPTKSKNVRKKQKRKKQLADAKAASAHAFAPQDNTHECVAASDCVGNAMTGPSKEMSTEGLGMPDKVIVDVDKSKDKVNADDIVDSNGYSKELNVSLPPHQLTEELKHHSKAAIYMGKLVEDIVENVFVCVDEVEKRRRCSLNNGMTNCTQPADLNDFEQNHNPNDTNSNGDDDKAMSCIAKEKTGNEAMSSSAFNPIDGGANPVDRISSRQHADRRPCSAPQTPHKVAEEREPRRRPSVTAVECLRMNDMGFKTVMKASSMDTEGISGTSVGVSMDTKCARDVGEDADSALRSERVSSVFKTGLEMGSEDDMVYVQSSRVERAKSCDNTYMFTDKNFNNLKASGNPNPNRNPTDGVATAAAAEETRRHIMTHGDCERKLEVDHREGSSADSVARIEDVNECSIQRSTQRRYSDADLSRFFLRNDMSSDNPPILEMHAVHVPILRETKLLGSRVSSFDAGIPRTIEYFTSAETAQESRGSRFMGTSPAPSSHGGDTRADPIDALSSSQNVSRREFLLMIKCLRSESARTVLLNQNAVSRSVIMGVHGDESTIYYEFGAGRQQDQFSEHATPLRLQAQQSPIIFKPADLSVGMHSDVVSEDGRSRRNREMSDPQVSTSRLPMTQQPRKLSSMNALLPLTPLLEGLHYGNPALLTSATTAARMRNNAVHPTQDFLMHMEDDESGVAPSLGSGMGSVFDEAGSFYDDLDDSVDYTAPSPLKLHLTGDPLASQLSREILDFIDRIDMRAERAVRAKTEVLELMRSTVQSLWPRAQVKVFGSFVSTLSLPSSDLDMVICLPKVHWEAGPDLPGVLEGRNAIKQTWQQNLARYLCKEDWVLEGSIKIIPNAAIPVLKLVARVGAMKVPLDVSFEGPGHKGLEANKMITSLLKSQPCLRPLVLVLKYFLTKRSLCESFTGGLSSYALLLMVARFLQEIDTKDIDATITDLGALLLGFLQFFGVKFDPRQTGVSVRRKCYFSRSIDSPLASPHTVGVGVGQGPNSSYMHMPLHIPQTPAMSRQHSFQMRSGNQGGAFHHLAGATTKLPFKFDPLFIEDPLEMRNNVGRNCFRIFQVQKSWTDAHCSIMTQLRMMEHGMLQNMQNVRLLDDLIGNVDELLC